MHVKNSPIFCLQESFYSFVDNAHTQKMEDVILLMQYNFLRVYAGWGKKSWMLAYSEGNHGIYGKEAEDYSIRDDAVL